MESKIGREESAQHSENRDDEGVEPDGEKERRGCDERHQQESWNRPEEIKVINRTARERNAIEDDNSGRAQSLRKHGEMFARHHHAADEQTETGEETNRHSQDGRDEIVVERVFDEKYNAEEQCESANPRKTFHPYELFPIDFRSRLGRRLKNGRRRGGRRRWRRKDRLGTVAIGLGGVTWSRSGVTSGCAGRAESDSTGFGDSFSRFSRAISDSSAPSRWKTSSMRFFALTARTINQIGIPKIIKMTSVILLFNSAFDSASRTLRPNAGQLQRRGREKMICSYGPADAATCVSAVRPSFWSAHE